MFRDESRRKRLRLVVSCGLTVALVVLIASEVTARRSPFEPLSIFAQALAYIELAYVEPIDQDQLVYGAIRGLAESLDPHTEFMDPEEYAIFNSDSEGRFAGIGVEVSQRDGWLTILSVFEGGPAHRAGLEPGDRFLTIEGEDARDLRLYDAVRRIRGEPGTRVQVTIRRADQSDALERTLTRAFIEIDPIEMQLLGDGLVYVRVKAFQDGTARAFSLALDDAVVQLKKRGGVEGLLIDLRDNGGGLLDEAVWLSNELLATGVIVSTRGRDGKVIKQYTARRAGTRPKWPVVVLVNENTASAAEIVAGALQDQRRATVVGARSFGKGSVQTVFELPGGSALKLTISRYYTPAGRSIQAQGIVPDLFAEQPRLSGEPDPVREESLPRHLAAAPEGKRRRTGAQAPLVAGSVPKRFDEDPQGARGYLVLRALSRSR